MKSTRFILLFSLAVISAGVSFVVHLALRNQNVALGYEVERSRNASLRLRNQVNQYRLELGAMRSPQNLEDIARNERAMVEPDRVPTLVVGGAVHGGRLSGRPR